MLQVSIYQKYEFPATPLAPGDNQA